MALISTNPVWYILFCVLAGLLFSAFLYYRNKKDGFSKTQIMVLACLRFCSVFILSFLLLSWVVRIERLRHEKPLLVLLHDTSESLKDIKDADSWKRDWYALEKQLGRKYRIDYSTFGESFQKQHDIDFSQKQTNFAQAFEQLKMQYAGQNLQALVIASDGIYTTGEYPPQMGRNLNMPIYTIAFGDTSAYKDLKIQKVTHNQYTYLNNRFPLKIELNAVDFKHTKATLLVEHDREKVFEKEILIGSDPFFESVEVLLKAESTGVRKYVVKIVSPEDEANPKNNVQDVFIEVLDNRRKILLLAAAPHPDISALKQSILRSDRYDIDFYMDKPVEKSLNAYDLIIFHQLPSKFNSGFRNQMQEALEQNIPVFIMVGQGTNIQAFNQYDLCLKIDLKGQQTTEAFPVANPDFTYFRLSETFLKSIFDRPPVEVPFAGFTIAEHSQILVYQKILGVTTEMPLILFSQGVNNRQALWVGDGLWRWRLNDYMRYRNSENTDELIDKIIQFLSAAKDKRPFRLDIKPIYNEIEPIELQAELYDDAYEFVEGADIRIEIKNTEGLVYPFTFSPASAQYNLKAGLLPVGDYTYEAYTTLGQKKHRLSGRFSVSPMNLESLNLQADHQMLNTLSKVSGAEMYERSQLEDLVKTLNDREDAKPTAYVDKDYHALINVKCLALLLILLCSAEWFLRRYWGSY